MLKSLSIKNVALIDAAEIDFKDGLNVLSGETGSGKSVILESLNFVLGAKADKTLIRSGESECFVSALFDVSDSADLAEVFEETGIEQDEQILISRRFSADGKGLIKLNGNPVTQSMLKKFTAKLVDVHGQSEHFYLLKNSNQLELVDKFTEKASKIKEEISILFEGYKSINDKISGMGGSDAERIVKTDILNYQINEIDSAELKIGEDEELLAIKRTLLNQEKIVGALSSVKNALWGDGGAGDIISNAEKLSVGISEFGENYEKLSERISALNVELSDIADSASSLLEEFNYAENDPDEIESRLDLIKNLKRKYGGSIEAVLEFSENAKKQLQTYRNYDALYAELSKEKSEKEKIIYEKYSELSKERRIAAEKFSERVIGELKELGMADAVFKINFKPLPDISQCVFNSINGKDEAEFVLSANKGEPEKPLSLVISGGEISRFMLAIKTQTAKFNNVSTFIFDEIDAGISGNTAKTVAQKFAKIAKNVQIIAITHLPQISAMGDNNLLIEKKTENGKTLTEIKELDEKGKIAEIVRLTGGDKNSESAKSLATELIKNSNEYKRQLK